jgi:hypothetical protein
MSLVNKLLQHICARLATFNLYLEVMDPIISSTDLSVYATLI